MNGDADGRPPAVRLRAISVVRGGVAILDGVDWDVEQGQRWAVLGPNGSGKTTLLRVAGMRLLPTRGTVEVLGQTYGRCDARAVRQRVAFVSQNILRGLRPTLSAHEVVLTGRHAALETWWHRYDEDDHLQVRRLLDAAGLAAASDRPFGVLSEGERQQVLLARALMAEPELLLLDEPAAGLDLGARERLVAYLAALAADPGTPPLVLVTHHVEELPAGITHAVLISGGRLVAVGAVADILTTDAVSSCFGVDVTIERADGRWTARAAPERERPGVTTDNSQRCP
jgi:iron complex transport system ATP-binding protein